MRVTYDAVEWDGKAQLRITPWPDKPVPLPRAARVPSQLGATRSVILPIFNNGIPVEDKEPVELTGETYLELEQVDLDDPDSILAFVNTYGCLGGWAAYHDLFQEATNREADPLFFFLYHERLDGDLLFAAKKSAVRDQMATLPKWVPQAERRKWRKSTVDRLVHQLPPVVETLDEFRFAARLLLDLKTAWQVLREGLKPESVVWRSDPAWQRPVEATDELRIALGEAPAHAVLGKVIKPSTFLTDVLDRLLHWFRPKLGMRIDYYPPAPVEALFQPPSEVSVEPQREPERAPLYAICALELFNHIVDKAEYHMCANDRCGRTFVYQHGRSEKGQRRSRGVLYCTPECARATAQREYRRRKRSAPT